MKEILNQLFQQQTLTREESKRVLIKLANGEYNATQMAAFLTVFQLRNITLTELQGFRDAMLELCISIDFSDFNTVDLCGTGGDNKDTFNISTLAAFVVAGAGEKVVKHGNYGVSSVCGSSNILEYFGYNFSNSKDKLEKELDTAGICFLHAPLFNPAMKNIAPIRKELAIKTFFNMLGPMVNPASPQNQLIGVYNAELARMYNYIYQLSGKNYCIVHSLDGYDEISLTGGFQIQSANSNSILSPSDLGLKELNPVELKGGVTIKESVEIFLNILKGNGSEAQNNVVIANAGYALQCIYFEKSIKQCLEKAKLSLKSGKALQSFNKIVRNK
ncbi:MAG: anthranilate phosphoribosyltransferase [Bacteroidetes bacterium GWF2_33_16]|nr:MAG: anthranilate phosphoribosyltransferase [Bacteroidetes bacterium GWE2_32_14]OFY04578.1 MAG: anthranilate phosphoribosyltransferase [Bacteroidetes bacterium GWF2_33_16]